MNKILKVSNIALIGIVLLSALSFTSGTASKRYKCMIQMTNYYGEGAYVVISLIKPDGSYDKTLFIQGKNSEWYHDVKEWWAFNKTTPQKTDGITGASLAGGERTVSVFEIEDSKLNKGYKLRFETAVEDQKYHSRDVEFSLTTESVKSQVEGKGYIRYVRLIPNS